METPFKPVEVFYSFAEADALLLKQLEHHLSVLEQEGSISTWHKRQIAAGSTWQMEIDHHLNTASLILLLISSDFLASDYCYGIEMQRALQRHKAREAQVVPILLRSCYWQNTPFAALQVLPTGARPITTWDDRDVAWTDVVVGIRRLLGRKSGAGVSNEMLQNASIRDVQKRRKHRWSVPGIVTSVLILFALLLSLFFRIILPAIHPAVTTTQVVSTPSTDPYIHKGTLVLADPLTSNNQKGWNIVSGNIVNGKPISSCDFKEQSYQVILQDQPSFRTSYCWNHALSLQDFVYQITVNLMTNTGSGIIFRLDANIGHFFYFGINPSAQYTLSEVTGSNVKNVKSDIENSAIISGLGQKNILAIVAEGDQISMYINKKLINSTPININNNDKGYIGVAVVNDTQTHTPGQANYTDAGVWSLDQQS